MRDRDLIATAGLVDFHCHLDLYTDYPAVMQETEDAGIFTLAVTTTPQAWPRNYELAQRTKHVRAALGLHPQLVADRASEISLWERYLPEARYIGEVGLDAGPRFFKSLDAQKRVFQRVLQCCADAGDKILTIHSVRSVKSVLDHLEAFLPADKGKVVLHWFTGTKNEAKRALELGCYFSINAAMFHNERHALMIQTISLDRILTETDGPFTRTGDRQSKPSDVAIVVEKLDRLHQVPTEQVSATVLDNLRNLVSGQG